MSENKTGTQTTLYNVLFPIWFLIIFPVTWLVILPANFIIDSLVILAMLKVLKTDQIKAIYKKVIIKVWVLGFTADLIGAAILLLTQVMDGDWLYEYIIGPVAFNPWDNIYSLCYVLLATLAAGLFIYIFNKKIAFKKVDLSARKKHAIALAMAILTAPYVFLIPSQLTYSPRGEIKCFTSHLIPDSCNLFSVAVPNIETERIQLVPGNVRDDFEDAIDTADRIYKVDASLYENKEPDYIVSAYNGYAYNSDTATVNIWIKEKDVLIQANDKWYRVESKRSSAFLNVLENTAKGEFDTDFIVYVSEGKKDERILIYEDSSYKYYIAGSDEKAFIEYANGNDIEITRAIELKVITVEDLENKNIEVIKEKKEL